MNEDKKKAFEIAVEQLHKAYGKGSIMKLGDHVDELAVASIPTGSLALDVALGCGGIPRGRIIEIYGPESGGKTTLALQMIAEAQKSSGIAAFIDAEHALDPKYAKAIGVELDELYISQPDCGEQALEITETLIRSGAVDLIVVDSVAALTPKAEIDGEMGDAHVGLIARLMSQACRKLTAAASSTGCTVIFINQLREKVGIMFGNPETTPGGRALKFYSSVRLEVRKIETVKRGTEAVSNKVRIKVVKNKVAPPFKEALTEITFGRGIDTIGETVDMATDAGIIRKGGAWFTLPNEEETRLQGRENVKAYYEEHDEELEKLKNVVRSKYITEDLEFVPDDENEEPSL